MLGTSLNPKGLQSDFGSEMYGIVPVWGDEEAEICEGISEPRVQEAVKGSARSCHAGEGERGRYSTLRLGHLFQSLQTECGAWMAGTGVCCTFWAGAGDLD